jgi:hypothetical protein
MDPHATTESGAQGAPLFDLPAFGEAVFPFQRGLTAMRRASECLLQGFMEVAAKQAEFGQRIMLESMAEWQDLSRVRGPEDLLQNEYSLARTQAERSISAMRSFNDDVRQCCFHAVDLAVQEMNAAMPKAVAVKKPARAAAKTAA